LKKPDATDLIDEVRSIFWTSELLTVTTHGFSATFQGIEHVTKHFKTPENSYEILKGGVSLSFKHGFRESTGLNMTLASTFFIMVT
jgi:hypothetical protein